MVKPEPRSFPPGSFFNRGETYLVPTILTFLNSFLINFQCVNFVRSWAGWLSGSFLVLGSL